MEKVVTKMPDKITYVTRDGVSYDKESKAIEHEEHLDRINHYTNTFHPRTVHFDGEYEAIFIKEITPAVKEELCKKYSTLITKELSIGWNLIREEDYGDGEVTYCYNAKAMLEQLRMRMIDLERLIITDPTV